MDRSLRCDLCAIPFDAPMDIFPVESISMYKSL